MIRDRLTKLGYSVEVQSYAASSYNVDADLILISNTVEAKEVAARLRSVRKPIVVLDFLLFDDMEMASTAGGSFKTAQIRVIDGDHVMANDPADPVLAVYRQATLMGYATAGTLPRSAERVAVTAADPSRVVIFGFAAGAAMDGGFTAPARRVGYHVTNARRLNATGWAMFDAMIQWARPSGSSAGSGDLSWDLASARHEALGCDLWQTTWTPNPAPDGSLATGWGDCVGPSPAPSTRKLGTMFARIFGSPADHTVVSIDTGVAGSYNDYPTSGIDSTGIGHTGWKPASFLHVDDRLWVWSFGGGDDSCTKSRLKFSTNPGAALPSFQWANWTFGDVGYVSFVQYGRGYEGGPKGYVYGVIPMLGPGKPGRDCLQGGAHFGLLRGNRSDLGTLANWEYFAGMSGGGPTWVSVTTPGSAGRAQPIFSSPGRTYAARGSLTYNAGQGLFFLTLPWMPPGCDKNRTRFCAGLEVWSAEEPWGPGSPTGWKLRFRSDTTWPGGRTNCGRGDVEYDRGAGEQAHFPPKWMSADGRTMHLVSSSADCLTIIRATLP